MRQSQEITILDAVTPQTVTSSTDATPIVVTKTAHGFSTGDVVYIYGHTTNVAANGIRKITVLSSSTFSLQDPYTGTNIAGSGAGSGSGGFMLYAPKVATVEDYQDVILNITTTGTATTTINIQGSIGKVRSDASVTGGDDCPTFGATVAKANPWTFINFIDYLNNAVVAGNTGLVISGAAAVTSNTVEVNVNGLKYLTVAPITWSAGAITVKAKMLAYNK